ncbi:hypothetical protein FJT64_021127 [Amphibalanus amphitrite]|uniref:Uncharacterized protein n=1 Tax=Amphibalanus amphitrite TaxID=1232801 RepID=A0A6A4WUR5_AMPAM|nr:hypothetical protein FJT64_021127 [Amphibalanus amphitrite]
MAAAGSAGAAAGAAAGLRPAGGLRQSGVLASCFCVSLALGSCFSIGNLTTYVTSYLRAGAALPVDYADTMWLDSVLRVTMGPLYALGGLLHARLGPRPATALGGGLVLLGTALSTLAVRGPLFGLIAAYSLLQGAGIGIALASVSLTCVAWFPRRCGLALGVNMGGFTLGPVLFNWVQTGYINRTGAEPAAGGYFWQPELLRRVPAAFLLQALVQAGLLTPALLLLRAAPAHGGQPHKAGLSVRQALRTRRFYQLLLGYVPTMVAFEFFQVTWKTFGQTFISDDRLLSTVGSVSPLFALAGNLLWGQLGDATSFRSALVVASGLLASLLCTVPAAPRLGAAAYCAWVWALAASCAALFACQLPLLRGEFGDHSAGVLLGLMNTARALFTPVTPLLARLLLLRRDGYPVLFLVQGGFALVAMCSLISVTTASDAAAARRAEAKQAEAAARP